MYVNFIRSRWLVEIQRVKFHIFTTYQRPNITYLSLIYQSKKCRNFYLQIEFAFFSRLFKFIRKHSLGHVNLNACDLQMRHRSYEINDLIHKNS